MKRDLKIISHAEKFLFSISALFKRLRPRNPAVCRPLGKDNTFLTTARLPRLRLAMTALRGFTLIELLVVVLIIGILAAVALPQYRKAVFSARMAEVEMVLSSLHNARKIHEIATGEAYPQAAEELDVSLPASCQDTGKRNDGRIEYVCGKYNIVFAKERTVAILSNALRDCNYCHFDKFYPSGEWKCRESDESSLFASYCKSKGYPVSLP